MNHFSQNLKYLRISKRLSQTQLGVQTKLNSSTISAYERGQSIPRIHNLIRLSIFFNRTVDELLNCDIPELHNNLPPQIDGKKIRILPITVDTNNKEQISLVPVKAAAGYTKGYADAEFIADLPHFQLPFSELSADKTYRVFQIEGDSMNPVQSGSYIICEYVQNWRSIKDFDPYILVSVDEGIVFKRLELDLENSRIHLHSDNPEYRSYELPVVEVQEIWRSLGYVSFTFPEKTNPIKQS